MISVETQNAMVAFFMETSIPKIMKEEKLIKQG